MKRMMRGIVMACGIAGMAACTFSNNLSRGDYQQMTSPPSRVADAEPAHLYISCRTYARHYDQVAKTIPCTQMFMLSGVNEASVQQEMADQFHHLRFRNPLKDTQLPMPTEGSVTRVVSLDIYEEYGWPRLAFQGLLSTLSLTLLPFNYPRHYTLTMEVRTSNGSVIRRAQREFEVDNWWWMPLMFAYPFYNERQAGENAILHLGRDLARELESH